MLAGGKLELNGLHCVFAILFGFGVVYRAPGLESQVLIFV